MPAALPPEIWVQVLALLPNPSLELAKRVNHLFNEICRDLLFRVLDLDPLFTGTTADKPLEGLRKQLKRARSRPRLIKKLYIFPIAYIPYYTTPAEPQSKPTDFLKRLFQKRRDGLNQAESRYTPDKAREVALELASLFPYLTSLSEMRIRGDLQWVRWDPVIDSQWKLAASRLTVLSLDNPLITSRPLFPSSPSVELGSISFPALIIFRLYSIGGHTHHLHSYTQQMVTDSPLLREVQYHSNSYNHNDNIGSYPLIAPSYHHLKVFKWTTTSPIEYLPVSATLIPFFSAHATQFNVVHLNPAPSLEAIRRLAIVQLVELRVDLGDRDGAEFFSLLALAEQLSILEVTGFYVHLGSDMANLLPSSGLGRLQSLYLGSDLNILSAESFGILASKIPNLQKLVLLFEPWNSHSWKTEDVENICRGIPQQFRLSTVHNSLVEWKLWDFGIYFRQYRGEFRIGIFVLGAALSAIAQSIPSIVSFYGTGTLNLWGGMEDTIDENWGGELWLQRRRENLP